MLVIVLEVFEFGIYHVKDMDSWQEYVLEVEMELDIADVFDLEELPTDYKLIKGVIINGESY